MQVYCNYGLYNEDSGQCIEEGDSFDRLEIWEDGELIVYKDVYITSIREDELEFKTDDFDIISVAIDDIHNFSI